jgi:hypothetical protein
VAKTITLDEMRERAGTLIFGADWISGLTDQQYELLRTYPLEPRDVHRTDGTTTSLPHVDPVPARLASKIDHAPGRWLRLDAQITTVDSWLQARGVFDHPAKTIDRKWFGTLIRVETRKQKKTGAPERRLGRPAQILPRVMSDMRRQIDEGKLTNTTLADLPEKELASQFSASRASAREARRRVLNGHG